MKRIMLTTTTCDNNYLDVMKVFLYTLNLHTQNKELVRADLINGNDDIYERFHRLYGNLEINHVEMPKGLNWYDHKNMLLLMYARIPRMWETLNEDWEQVMTIDSDVIIRKPFDSIWDDVEPSTIKIWDRGPKKQPFTRVQAGVHIFGNSPEIKDYYQAFMKDIGAEWEFEYGQAAIYAIYLKFRNKIRIVQMSQKYNDSKFKDKSIIWHAKHGHFKEKKFQKEFQECLKEANKIYED